MNPYLFGQFLKNMNYNELTDEVELIKVPYQELDSSYEYFMLASPFAVYPFHKAPKWARDISINGGDEDWICICSLETWNSYNQYIPWVERLGYCDVDGFLVDDKYVIFIGSHA